MKKSYYNFIISLLIIFSLINIISFVLIITKFSTENKNNIENLKFENIVNYNKENLPIFINNFNNYYTLHKLVDDFYKKGYRNIYVLDNKSTYKPLLKYYKENKKIKVIYLNKNYGHKSIWDCPFLKDIFKYWFVYTDPDLDISNVPDDFLIEMMNIHKNNKLDKNTKIGCALEINDIPEFNKKKKKEIIDWETQFWNSKNLKIVQNQKIYHTQIDTTLALYPPNYINHNLNGYRVAGEFTIKHLPWYLDEKNLPENEIYYRKSKLKNVGHWSSK